VTLKMPAFEWVHVQLHQQKGMISLSPPTICNSAIVPALNAVERASAEAITRAVFFNRLGEIRDRSFEQQRYRASGLNLVTAAIVLWNTVYLERAANALRGHGQAVDDGLLQYLSPLGWEHINLTGDYLWRSSAKIGAGKFRPLRPLQPA
ncbi:Tn3 family transposase, partial [Enterobacter hormaechei]|uniref:Tn3 family transposase n=1 Tax=Enterobacter hormaechei TaxID=158836 RepID=UPI002147F9BA